MTVREGNYPLAVGRGMRYDFSTSKRRRKPVTICLAAICTHRNAPMIVGVSDRKYTAGDWTYEPPQTKRYKLSEYISILISGDLAPITEICYRATLKFDATPTPDVAVAADMVARAFAEYRRVEAERHLLFPLGLSLDTYRKEKETFVKRMDDQLRRWELEEQAIVAGIDPQNASASLYVIADPGWARCENAAGFASVGSGSGHATAEFMRAKYQRIWSPERALLLAYRAKRAAEVDPFVGLETDMFVIGYGLPTSPLNDDLYEGIRFIYDQTVEAEKAAVAQGDEDVETYVQAFFNEQEEETVQQTGIQAVDEQKQLHEGFEEGESEDSSTR